MKPLQWGGGSCSQAYQLNDLAQKKKGWGRNHTKISVLMKIAQIVWRNGCCQATLNKSLRQLVSQ